MNSHNFGSLFTPDYSHLTGLVKHLNAEELKSILNNDDKANEIISDLKQVKDIEAEREMLIASNKSISDYNLSRKSELQESQENLDFTYKRAVELKEKLLTAKASLENRPEAQSKDTLLALLQTAASEIEEEAEATVNAFLKNDLSVEDFLEKYLELKKLSHLRRIKSEKLVLIIRNGGTDVCTPEKPQRLRKPPPPPVPNTSPFPYPNVSPYANNIANRNIPVGPSRPAPQPPTIPNQNVPYPNPNSPMPYNFSVPYAVRQPFTFVPYRKT